jgi:hypothetical protein
MITKQRRNLFSRISFVLITVSSILVQTMCNCIFFRLHNLQVEEAQKRLNRWEDKKEPLLADVRKDDN